MKKLFIKILFFVSLIFILFCFYKVNEFNYLKHKIIKENLVKHPEHLPTKEVALNTSFWFRNLKADMYWLETIQYIWGNALSSEYKRFLFAILDLVTELNPYFQDPYLIGQLLLPSYNERYENMTDNEQSNYVDQWIKIWLKWIKNFCDKEKIKLIKNEGDLNTIWVNEKYKNPCKDYKIPYYLAYIYYFYKNDPLLSSQYYKIASANDNSLEWSKIMAAIMQWKWWNREKSYFMFLNMAKLSSPDEICINFTNKLELIWIDYFKKKKIDLNWELIKSIWELRNQVFWEFINKEDEENPLYNTQCWSYVNKATRELNLKYIENWNEKYIQDNEWRSAAADKELFEKWYIDYLPIDFQQYWDYWIIYKYNFDTKNFDYEMGYDLDEE